MSSMALIEQEVGHRAYATAAPCQAFAYVPSLSLRTPLRFLTPPFASKKNVEQLSDPATIVSPEAATFSDKGKPSRSRSGKTPRANGQSIKVPSPKQNNVKPPSSSRKSSVAITKLRKQRLEEKSYFDESLIVRESRRAMHQGDRTFNLLREGEDVIAPWSVDGFTIDLPDWRPQPQETYGISDQRLADEIQPLVENMFGAQVKLVSTIDGIWRFLYEGTIRNLIGAEAWLTLLLQEELGPEEVKAVRFETMYHRDWPEDYN